MPTAAKKADLKQTQSGAPAHELEDLVVYFNASARVGRRGMLWCGWNASQWKDQGAKTRNTSPAAGAHCVLITTWATRLLLAKVEDNLVPDMHMGNFLSKNVDMSGSMSLERLTFNRRSGTMPSMNPRLLQGTC